VDPRAGLNVVQQCKILHDCYWKSKFPWVDKTSNEGKINVYKNIKILMLILNLFTTETEAPAFFFFFPLSQGIIPRVSSVALSHLPSFLHYCWSAAISTSSSGKWVVDALSAIREGGQTTPSWNSIRRWSNSQFKFCREVVRQLPIEMLQQCYSRNSFMRTPFVMEEHYN
jgi:hypothetical protein